MLSNAAGDGVGKGEAGADHGDECSDSDTEDARCGHESRDVERRHTCFLPGTQTSGIKPSSRTKKA